MVFKYKVYNIYNLLVTDAYHKIKIVTHSNNNNKIN